MRIPPIPHRWDVSPKRAIEIQRSLAQRVNRKGAPLHLKRAAGLDLSFTRDGTQCIAGVVVWDVREQFVVEQHVARRALRFPYVPGLLSFREAPALLTAIRKLCCEPDVFIFDGQGYAHPRRFGLACHVGVLIDKPSVGCAKSVLVGAFDEPGTNVGDASPLSHNNEIVGMALRTRRGVKPVLVSPGHRISMTQAVRVVLACCTKYRLPEPTRLADQLVSRARVGL